VIKIEELLKKEGKQMMATNKKRASPVNKKYANAAFRSVDNWKTLNWDYHRRIVKKLQLRIAKATQVKKFRRVKALQWILTHSLSAKLLAVKKVMQNKGSKTPGVDGILIKTAAEKLTLAKNMKRRGYQPSPLRRIYIPKAGNPQKRRPLGIPTITDRCQQALHSLALIPVAETSADQNSYGFRPERRCADAIEQTFLALAKRTAPQWILEGDIKGCFDHISHEWMINNICMDKMVLEKWLRAGFIETKKLFPTEAGTPQGGIISPVLCNMTLDGIAQLLATNFKGHKGIFFVRYADDFIITSHSRELLEKEIKPAITAFLKERGLELSQDKTKITHIKEGFDFLGQNVRKYSCQGKDKLLIKPSPKSIHSFLEAIRQVIRKARSTSQVDLIKKLNPKIRGWANYHQHIVAKHTFAAMDHKIWHLSLQWAKRRHSNKKNMTWILQKYYRRSKGVTYRFGTVVRQEDGIPREEMLFNMGCIPIRRHVKIRKQAHPYDVNYDEYFEKRTSEKWKNNSQRLSVQRHIIFHQKSKCPCCSKELRIQQNWCISLKRKSSIGGEYQSSNMDIIHHHCYEKWQSKSCIGVPAIGIKDGLNRARAG
jgi:RNA-directed DNA polymerase